MHFEISHFAVFIMALLLCFSWSSKAFRFAKDDLPFVAREWRKSFGFYTLGVIAWLLLATATHYLVSTTIFAIIVVLISAKRSLDHLIRAMSQTNSRSSMQSFGTLDTAFLVVLMSVLYLFSLVGFWGLCAPALFRQLFLAIAFRRNMSRFPKVK